MLYYILPTSLLFNVSFSANYSLCGFQGALVGSSGLEPPTSRLSGVRSNLLSYEPSSFSLRPASFQLEFVGGDERVRTDDPLLAKQVLSQLSYTPTVPRPSSFCPECFLSERAQNYTVQFSQQARNVDDPILRRDCADPFFVYSLERR